jgi:prepilin-type processing-associated H-X9-DG protein
MARWRSSKGLTRVEVLVVVLAGVVALALLSVVSYRGNPHPARLACAANLATLGKAMLLYANDYAGEFPRAGGRATMWGEMVHWDASSREAAFELAADGLGGAATISSCFYLLVKYAEVEPPCFICPGDAGTTQFRLPDGADLPRGFKLIDAWDFGPEAYKHCSYAYHLPFGLYALTTSHDRAMPLAADRNPWLPSPGRTAGSIAGFKPDLPAYKGTAEQARQGNSPSHKGDGQNVLFVDGHVAFEERGYCGLDNDNIYLVANDPTGGSPVGMVPAVRAATPLNRRDSVLVHDPVYQVKTPAEAPNVDSKSLKQTAVVATLDCPLPEHKNVIWCSTFQMAWDKLKRDVIGEPIQIPAAQELADRLNRSEFPTGSIDEKSCYVAAGFVKNGIIEQVQKEMARRFPSEPVPTFDEKYRTLLDVILAYAYLNVAVEFEQPYCACPGAFEFRDSMGERTSVAAFRAQAYDRVQVEILYHDFGQSPDTAQFVVDLSKRTQPYQVVLARVPQCRTLRDAAKAVQEKIAEFATRPHYEAQCKLQPIDTLTVPDVLYKLTHHFEELLDKDLRNAKWPLSYISEAMQKIDFALSRKGVVLKSEARVRPATRGVSRDEQKPRHFHFDRPFLICVQKREPNATPFFLMWVDNAELMKPYGSSVQGS